MNEEFLTREAHIMQIDDCTKKFVQTYYETECADCYNQCNHSNEQLLNCITAHFNDYIIVDENNPHNKVEE